MLPKDILLKRQPEYDLHGQTVVLTGGSSGIGRDAVKQMLNAGASVCVIARSKEALHQLKKEVSKSNSAQAERLFLYPCDLTDTDAANATCALILSEHDQIDALVNNAARSIRRPIIKALDRLHDYQRTIEINYIAAVNLCLQFIPRFIQQGHGHVVNVSTMSSQVPIPLFSAYLGSKSALESFTRSLHAELSGQGITTTTVYFPMVRTPMSSRTDIYKHMPMMTSEKAADWLVKGVAEKPIRVASPLGNVGGVIMSAIPKQAIDITRPFFTRMDKRLKKKLDKSG